ncbi:hypothetical protein IW261DRAFT_1510493 [Armillaria novae-zelandiae]|uniref:Alpha/beta hydrolase fold-3 domain-containing protein n=1 Tax=Armillaria novae-zelandiae TaxID=153914 RepID=A0AA39TWF3_9AGAR|nr:hypothetical protein IW261DRAFT_1510493 [Armillaria novae-zelandiae]
MFPRLSLTGACPTAGISIVHTHRLAPETHFPGPLHDAVIGYFRLIEDLHIPPENIIICGDSAGGHPHQISKFRND